MQLRQLKYVVEIHKRGNHISAAARALNTSQPGMSKQIQLLEYELGFAIFQRKRNRVIGLTDPGRTVIEIAQRILNDVDSLRHVREDYSGEQAGALSIATTHTYARYILPKVIDRFVKRYPQVHISLVQGNPTEICEAVDSGQADLAVGTESIRPFPNLVKLASIPITRSLVAREGHPILKAKTLSLKEIAKYPIIAHDRYRSGQWKIMNAFREHGIEPRVLFDSVDADVSKTYVELGLGIAILASVAVDPKHDPELRARDVGHLFESSTTYISLRANSYLRGFVFDFVQMLDPALKPEKIRAALRSRAAAEASPSAAVGRRG